MNEPNGPRRKQEVQRRARQIMEKKGMGYGKAMKIAGWLVRNATGNREAR